MKTHTQKVAAVILGLLFVNSVVIAQVANYFAGFQSGTSNTGSYNAFVGYQSGVNANSGWYNTFLGYQTGYLNSGGSYNVFIGSFAGYDNSSGLSNTFVGWAAGSNNTTASSNSFFGNLAGYQNSIGTSNSFFGSATAYNNSTGSYNSFFGSRSGYNNTTASSNTFVGYSAGEKNTIGGMNVFLGARSGFENTGGYDNTFVGAASGVGNTMGSQNSFFGSAAGQSNLTGNMNTFFGASSGFANTTGYDNTFVGMSSGKSNTTGYRNAFFGIEAGEKTSSGRDNTFIGRNAGRNNVTGSNNAVLGSYAGPASSGLSNTTAIGAKAFVRVSDAVVLGSVAGENGASATARVGIGTTSPAYLLHVNGVAAKPGGGSWTVASDKRLKQDIQPFKDGLNAIDQINPVWFRYNGKAGLPTDKRFVGVIAQDMQKVAPYTIGEFVSEAGEGQSERYLDYDANALTYILVNAVKELNTIAREQSAEIKKLQEEIATLKGSNLDPNDAVHGARLWQNFPNPYSTATVIRYYVPDDAGTAQLRITSITGQEVFSRELTTRGESEIEVSNHALATGSYIYQLIVDGAIVDHKKMVISR